MTKMTRTVLVTGANRGIGLAIARRLAELGNFVLLGARDLKDGENAAESLRRLGLDVAPVHMDLTVAATIDAAIDNIDKSKIGSMPVKLEIQNGLKAIASGYLTKESQLLSFVIDSPTSKSLIQILINTSTKSFWWSPLSSYTIP